MRNRKDEISNLKFIQSDVAISPGNSGGPMIDRSGNIVGISVQKWAGRASEGLSLFIPISSALKALNIEFNS
jgi:S1-C subfamily serine protease